MSERDAETVMREDFGYHRRPGQSTEFVTVPLALLQEAWASAMPGDAKSLLAAILVKSPHGTGRP